MLSNDQYSFPKNTTKVTYQLNILLAHSTRPELLSLEKTLFLFVCRAYNSLCILHPNLLYMPSGTVQEQCKELVSIYNEWMDG